MSLRWRTLIAVQLARSAYRSQSWERGCKPRTANAVLCAPQAKPECNVLTRREGGRSVHDQKMVELCCELANRKASPLFWRGWRTMSVSCTNFDGDTIRRRRIAVKVARGRAEPEPYMKLLYAGEP